MSDFTYEAKDSLEIALAEKKSADLGEKVVL